MGFWMSNSNFLQKDLIEVFARAKNIFVFTGAGASKESGLPTFREIDGEWKRFDPMTFATMEGFVHDPVLVWNMYRSRQKQIAHAQPNLGHITLACMESYYSDFLLVTQNVDDLHERAGSEKMVKIHGDAWQMRCLVCSRVFDVRDHDFPEEFTMETLPKCPRCGEICRPNIVWFGEFLCAETLRIATYHASKCDLMIIVGTSGEVSNGYGFAEFAFDNGAKIVEINPMEGALTQYADFWVAEPAGEALPKIWGEVLSYKL